MLKRRRTVVMGTCTGSVAVQARHDVFDEAQLFSISGKKSNKLLFTTFHLDKLAS